MTDQLSPDAAIPDDETVHAANATRAAEAAALASDAFARSDDAYRALAAELRMASFQLGRSDVIGAFEVAAAAAAEAASAAADAAERTTPRPRLVPDEVA